MQELRSGATKWERAMCLPVRNSLRRWAMFEIWYHADNGEGLGEQVYLVVVSGGAVAARVVWDALAMQYHMANRRP